MRKTMATLVAAGALLLGVAAASPALAKTAPLTQLCSPGTNGGTLVNGVCVLPNVNVGQSAEEFILTSGGVNTFTIVSGSLPPGLSMPATFGAAGTIVAGTPTQQGTFTFTVNAVPFANPQLPGGQQTFSITLDPPLPLLTPTTTPLPPAHSVTPFS